MTGETGKDSLTSKLLRAAAFLGIITTVAYINIPRREQSPSFGVIRDGKCLISNDYEMFTALKGQGVEAFALHTDGVDNHGSKARCLSAVMARIVQVNGLHTNESLNGDPNPVLKEGIGYLVPYFATTKHEYEGTRLDVEKILVNHGYPTSDSATEAP